MDTKVHQGDAAPPLTGVPASTSILKLPKITSVTAVTNTIASQTANQYPSSNRFQNDVAKFVLLSFLWLDCLLFLILNHLIGSRQSWKQTKNVKKRYRKSKASSLKRSYTQWCITSKHRILRFKRPCSWFHNVLATLTATATGRL